MNPIVERYIPLVTFLGETLPDTYEVLLLDLTEKGVSVAAQRNARRGSADAIRRYLKTVLKSETVVRNGMLTSRGDVMQRDKLERTSILLIKDEGGKPVGALALSLEIGALLSLHSTMAKLLTFDMKELTEIGPRQDMSASAEEPTLDTIDEMLAKFTDQPERMTIDEKTELIVDLYDTGVFKLKGAVARAAFALNMSQQSVYRYLAKIRRLRGE